MSNLSTLIANDIASRDGCNIGRKPKDRELVGDGPIPCTSSGWPFSTIGISRRSSSRTTRGDKGLEGIHIRVE